MKILQQQAARLFAIAAIFMFYGLSRLPELPQTDRAALADSFAFSSSTLPELDNYPQQVIRDVHPDLKHIDGWLSAMGAAVGLNDLDGDGLPNDVCRVDIRIDQVIISPAPGTPERYQPFALDPTAVRFEDEAMAPVGCVPSDMNEDGLMDILVYYWGRPPIAFLNQAASSAEPLRLTQSSYTPIDILPGDEVWWSSGGTFADFDGDGHQDLLITNYFPDNTILLGDGDGPLIHMQHSLSRAFNGGGTHLFLWDGADTGPEPTVQYKKVEGIFAEDVAHAWTLAVGATDLDGDLLPEIYFANDYGPDRLLHNRSTPDKVDFTLLEGKRQFTTPKSRTLGYDSFKGMGVDFGDVNNDGLFDIYISNIAADYALHESHFLYLNTGNFEGIQRGTAPFIDEGEKLGISRSSWGWESRLADFNNDGHLEAVQSTGFMRGQTNRWAELQELGLGSDELTALPETWPRFTQGDDLNGYAPNRFYVQSADGRFVDLAAELDLDQPQVSRGIATADVDGDGDLDFAVANQWESSRFYHNECPDCGSFLGLNLMLPVDGQAELTVQPGHPEPGHRAYPAVGAFARVHLPDGRQLVSTVDGGNGQSGARSSDIHFGLGQLDPQTELTVELRWRDATGQPHEEAIQVTPGWHTILLNR